MPREGITAPPIVEPVVPTLYPARSTILPGFSSPSATAFGAVGEQAGSGRVAGPGACSSQHVDRLLLWRKKSNPDGAGSAIGVFTGWSIKLDHHTGPRTANDMRRVGIEPTT
jgi:hypothetical protein